MREGIRHQTALSLVAVLVCFPSVPAAGVPRSRTADPPLHLRDTLQKRYAELFELAPTLRFEPQEIRELRDTFKTTNKSCRNTFRNHARFYQKQIDSAQISLTRGGETLTDTERHRLHCAIQSYDLLKTEAEALSGQAIPTAYENLNAKLDIVEQWPEQYRRAMEEVSSGTYTTRRWGNVKDIGFRVIASGQQEDIKQGQQAIEEMRRAGLLSPALENKGIQTYVDSVAQRVARHSDLKVPLHVTVLNSQEVNAFALPGGYVFVERGLLEKVDDESELAGVIAHEIAHDAARHSAKMMKRAKIASMFYQAAQAGAQILTGGVAGIAMSYALRYGFYGLGLVIDLRLLGVNREYELEADQLGIQYAWNSGYDMTGFSRLFDKMATKEGYVKSVSWFRTHPPFYERMLQARREMMFMPRQREHVNRAAAFRAMKKALAPVAAASRKEELNQPALLMIVEEGCNPPKRTEYKPGQPIEEICEKAVRTVEMQSPEHR